MEIACGWLFDRNYLGMGAIVSDPEKKIIVDEDWKSQVAAEKERLEQERQTGGESASKQLPASLEMLVSLLATEAMVALGQLPLAPGQEPAPANLAQAQFFIDLLGVLEEKTRGNLTSSEAGALENVLHELRLTFVAVRSSAESAGSR